MCLSVLRVGSGGADAAATAGVAVTSVIVPHFLRSVDTVG